MYLHYAKVYWPHIDKTMFIVLICIPYVVLIWFCMCRGEEFVKQKYWNTFLSLTFATLFCFLLFLFVYFFFYIFWCASSPFLENWFAASWWIKYEVLLPCNKLATFWASIFPVKEMLSGHIKENTMRHAYPTWRSFSGEELSFHM